MAGATADRFVWRHIDRIVAVGTTEVHDILEPLGEIDTAAEYAAMLAQWQVARAAYTEGRFEAAIAGFTAVLTLRPDDGPSHAFIARCRKFLKDGPPPGWDGVWRLDTK